MEPETLRKLRGSVELTASAFEAAVGASAEMQQAIVRQVYRPFGMLGPLAARSTSSNRFRRSSAIKFIASSWASAEASFAVLSPCSSDRQAEANMPGSYAERVS